MSSTWTPQWQPCGALTERDSLASWWSTKVDSPTAAVGARAVWTFAGDFHPVMETIHLDAPREVTWRCVAGHEPWQDSTFRFQVDALDDGRTRLRFWQEYAVELADDYYGVYNFNWGYYLESLRLVCTTGTGKPFRPGGDA
jgi:Activator of Hsp90 ATPase homolog 1-like protein